jgi:uncharacterized membrane protein YtjA (UPF0391 family)
VDSRAGCQTLRLPWEFGGARGHPKQTSEAAMLHYAVVFFIIAIVAAIFGFGGIAAGAAGIAKVLFVLFLIGAVIALVAGRPWA